MSDTLFLSDGTASSGGTLVSTTEVSTPTFASLARRAAFLRDRAQLTHGDVADLHRTTQIGALDERTSRVALQDASQLLESLTSDYGLSWTTIARMVGVTDAAVRKWRRGEQVAPENRRRLARSVAFLQTLEENYPIRDAASWLEMRVSDQASVKAVEVYAEGRVDLLLELVGQRIAPQDVLDAYDPTWRENYAVDQRFTVEDGPDGQPVIVQQRRDEA